MLIYSNNTYSPEYAIKTFKQIVALDDGVRVDDEGIYSIQFIKGINYKYHNLNDTKQFSDAVTRYSYLAKVDDKEHTRHKGFGVIKVEPSTKEKDNE